MRRIATDNSCTPVITPASATMVRGAARLGVVAMLLLGAAASYAAAEDTTPGEAMPEVVITGTRILRIDNETPAPVQVITAEQMQDAGATSVQQALQSLTANGQGMLSQNFSGAFASGAAGVALRGLTVGATLVLIDGHRTAPYPIGDDGQRTFVDVSNLPFDAVERVEVLKDGASAIYGSDAIAGVVNIILRKSYQGASLSAEGGQTSNSDGGLVNISGIWGMGDLAADGHNFYLSAEFRKQSQILRENRGGLLSQTDFTSSGGIDTTLGVSNILNGGVPDSATGYVLDSSGGIAGFMPGCDAAKFAANHCTFTDTWDQIQPPTQNVNLVGRLTQKLSADWQVILEGGYFESKSQQVTGPSKAFTGGYQGVTSGPGVIPTLLDPLPPTTISATNPSFPSGTGLTSAILNYTLLNVGANITETDAKSYRAVFDLDGKLGGWDTNFSAGYTEVALDITGLNYVNPGNLQIALDSTTAPFLVGKPNSAAVNNFVAPRLSAADTSKLSFGHVGVTRSLMDLQGGPLGVALGADYFVRDQYAVAPADVANGLTPNFSNNFTIGTQRVASASAELALPFTRQFEVDVAARYDHYNLSGGKTSPKIGFKYAPIRALAIRGTASRGFRAPSPAENGQAGQTFFAQTIVDPVLCPNPADPSAPGNYVGQCNVNVATIQGTNPNLKPETSKAFTLGLVIEPFRDISATLDFYSIEIDDQIVSGGAVGTVRGTNLAPIQLYQPGGGTALSTPPVAPIAYQTTSYINANTTKTTGFELGLQYHHRFGDFEYQSEADWSYMNKYDLTVDGTTYKLAGTHGPFIVSGDTGNPKSRVQWSNTFKRDRWAVTGTVNYVSAFNVTDPSAIASIGVPMDTCIEALQIAGAASVDYANQINAGTVPAAVSCSVASYITFDLHGKFDVSEKLRIHGTVLNLFNEKAPLDWATYGGALGAVPWNPSLHLQGAVGPFYSLGATYSF
jgi:iron complex outermembrane receptor protein